MMPRIHQLKCLLFKPQVILSACTQWNYQDFVYFANFCLKVLRLILIRVAVCGTQATEEGGWKLEAFGLFLFLWCRLLLPHHLTV